MISRPRALLFDLDHTLAPELTNYTASFDAACAGVCRDMGIDPGLLRTAVWQAGFDLIRASEHWPVLLALGVDSPSSLLTEFNGDVSWLLPIRSWVRGYQRASYAAGLATLGVNSPELADGLAAAFKAAIARQFPPYDDVIPVLEQLTLHYKLGVVTNGPADLQRAKLRSAGIDRYFQVVVASTEAGVGKPESRIFLAALEVLGVEAADAVMIGDSFKRDIAGARAAGLRAIWLRRGDGWPLLLEEDAATPVVQGTPMITTLAELPQVLSVAPT